MTTTVSFLRPTGLIQENNLPLKEGEERVGILKVPVIKDGNEALSVKVTFSAASRTTASRYLDRAVKGSTGDFNARSQTLEWKENETGVKYAIAEVYVDDVENEQGEYFYVTLSKNTSGNIGLWRTHYFMFDDLAAYLSNYIEGQFSLKGAKPLPKPITPGQMNFVIKDVLGVDYPASLLPEGRFEQEKVNKVIYSQIGNYTKFNFEFHIERIEPVDPQAIKRYNQENGTQLSEYSTVYLELPFTNHADVPVPITLAMSQVWNFRKMQDDEMDEKVNASLSAAVLPHSNLVYMEYSSEQYKTALDVVKSVTRGGREKKASFNIIGSGMVPAIATEGITQVADITKGQIESILKDVWYMSEGDYKWDVEMLPNGDLTPANLREVSNLPEGTLGIETYDSYKDPLQSQVNGEFSDNYLQLINIVDSYLTNVVATRVWAEESSAEIRIVILGKAEPGKFLLMRTTSIET